MDDNNKQIKRSGLVKRSRAFRTIVANDKFLIYESLSHEFSSDKIIQKTICFLYILQQIEKHKKEHPEAKAYLGFDLEDDSYISFSTLAEMLDFEVEYVETVPEKQKYFENKLMFMITKFPDPNMKTYLFVNKEYPSRWIDIMLPIMIENERARGYKKIRFITTSKDAKDKLLEKLKNKQFKSFSVDFFGKQVVLACVTTDTVYEYE